MLEIIQKFINKLYKIFFVIFLKSSFKEFGRNSTITFPFQIDGAKYIKIKNKVHIHKDVWLLAFKNGESYPELLIEENTYIGRFAHIVCTSKILIRKSVLISDKVYISDNLHKYQNINIPIKDQGITTKGEVSIGEHTWLGENVCVIGASVGKHCIIGANTVVVKDIPDYSIAIGSPAKVIKQFNKKKNAWEKVNNS